MMEEKILMREVLEEVSGGGVFGGEKKQRYQVGDKLSYMIPIAGVVVSSIYKDVVVVKCLGKKKDILYDFFEYVVRDEHTGEEYIATQSRLVRR